MSLLRSFARIGICSKFRSWYLLHKSQTDVEYCALNLRLDVAIKANMPIFYFILTVKRWRNALQFETVPRKQYNQPTKEVNQQTEVRTSANESPTSLATAKRSGLNIRDKNWPGKMPIFPRVNHQILVAVCVCVLVGTKILGTLGPLPYRWGRG